MRFLLVRRPSAILARCSDVRDLPISCTHTSLYICSCCLSSTIGGKQMHEWFRKFAHKSAEAVGSPWAFLIAFLITIAWAISGPYFGFSDTWQLVINTASTISTGL